MDRRRSVAARRRSLAIAVLAVALGLLGAGSASASTWKLIDLPDEGVRAALYGVSCPSPSLCVAVGGNNTIASSTDPAAGVRAWGTVHPVPLAAPLGIPSSYTYGGGQIRGVSCPSAGFCVAASFEGDIYSSTNPTGPASAWKMVPLTAEKEPNIHMGGISCPTPSFCVTVALGGKVVVSSNPGGERVDWTVIELAAPYDLRGVSCASVSLCVAVDNEGAVVVSTAPAAGPSAWVSVGQPGGLLSLNGVSCPSATLCVSANAGRVITSSNPSLTSAWKSVAAGSGLPVKGVSCPTASACAAVDNNADVMVSANPTGGSGAWSFKNVLPFNGKDGAAEGVFETNGMFAISCATTALCVAAGQEYRLLVSTNPFEDDAPKVPIRKGGRPHVVITQHPAKRVEARKGGTPVRFGFRAVGKAQRFKCKLAGRRFKACTSPVRYRVGRGKLAFKVRALAPGGGAGPIATFHFRVGKLTERPPVGSCPEGSGGSVGAPCVRARG